MRLREYDDFYHDIIVELPRRSYVAVHVVYALKDIGEAKSDGDIIRWLEQNGAGVSCRQVYKVCKDLSEMGIIVGRDTVKWQKKSRQIKCGIYSIRCGDVAYIGQSQDIRERWASHRREISLGTHNYFHSQPAPQSSDLDEYQFEIVHECDQAHLLKYEMLVAQKIKTQGITVLNEKNFNLI